jgi:serine/threonine-protein kinase
MFRVGDKVGDYEIVARLRSGGMATLFLARRVGVSGFHKHVAIKMVHPHLAQDPTFVQMFVDEALLSAQIDHPNVVHVEELRQLDGNHFLVMEYVDGCSLALLMLELAKRERRLHPDLGVHIAVRVADGLHAAHELSDSQGQSLGVVHRDVSPQNVLLAWKGHVKLIDFGVAKARDRSAHTTGASLKGKIRYMAPEQAFGRPIDRRSDIYALGVVLWETLTMHRCFRSENDLALLEEVRHPQIPPPSTFASDITPAVDAAVMRALAVEPDDRYATARDFRRALIEAAPGAATLDASSLSELLMVVMEDFIKKSRAVLPDSISNLDPAELEARARPQREALQTMTVSGTDLASFVDFRSAEPSAGTPGTPPPAAASMPSTSSRGSTVPWLAGGLAAGAFLAVIGALALGGGGSTDHSGPIAIPLEDRTARRTATDAGTPVAEADSGQGAAVARSRARDAGAAVRASEGRATRDAGTRAGERQAQSTRRDDRVTRSSMERRATERTMRPTMRTSPMTGSGVPIAEEFGF